MCTCKKNKPKKGKFHFSLYLKSKSRSIAQYNTDMDTKQITLIFIIHMLKLHRPQFVGQ